MQTISYASEGRPESFLVHSNLEIVYAGPAFCTLAGTEPSSDVVGTLLTDLVKTDYRTALSEQVTRIDSEDTPALGLTVEFETMTGQTQSGIVVSSLIEWHGNRAVQTSVFPVASEASERYRLLHDRAIEEAPVGITISDPSEPDNPLIYVNDEFCELTGYCRDEALGRNCRFLQGERTREKQVEKMRTAIDDGHPVSVELRNYREAGTMF